MGQKKYKRKFKSNNALNHPSNTTATTKSKPTLSTTRVNRKHLWIYAVILVGITFFVFLPRLSLKFVNWDDPDNLLQNKTLAPFAYEWDWQAVKSIFTSHVMGGRINCF